VTAERKGERLGALAYRLDRKHRERTQANLRLAFPDWSEAKIQATAKEVFLHFGRITGDFLRSPARTNEEVLAATEVENEEYYWEAVNRGKGILAITGHFGNWERVAQVSMARGRPLAVVARPANDESLENLVLATREATGLKVLRRGDSARAVLRELRDGGAVSILPDQNSDECFVPFFGHPAGCSLGPAVLQQRSGASLFTVFGWRVAPGMYRLRFQPLINTDGALGPEEVMAAIHRDLEDVIRLAPEQYLWMHDRWKSARRRGLLAA
jgi:KDO2-lipid IV(A) lauroyltransferase